MNNYAADYFPVEVYASESNKIEGIYSAVADWDVVSAHIELMFEDKLTIENIKEAQRKITRNQDDLDDRFKGEFRDCNVWIGGRLGSDPGLVGPLMDNWVLDYESVDPLVNHVRFEKIHPFGDGNGRTGRMLYWYQCLKRGETPILFTADRNFDYYKLFGDENA